MYGGDQTELSRQILEMKVSGRRGRPKTRWKDSVIWDMSIRVQKEEAMDRVVWRRVVHHYYGDLKV